MKKRKKTDPGMLLAKENKKIKKLEKDMKRLSRYGRKLKPVEEIIGTVYVRRNAE
jgi:large subunit ribosomal protein L40